ncbi:uncharacterized protein LOC141618625 [Silene latifolia]|uniref:uncharacterized protein LOC141618625 n=1 Tax=Silene latifolia TaxID=37657 RepID=UPI003D77BC9D
MSSVERNMRKEYAIIGLTYTPSREMGISQSPWPETIMTKILGPPPEELTTTEMTSVKYRVAVAMEILGGDATPLLGQIKKLNVVDGEKFNFVDGDRCHVSPRFTYMGGYPVRHDHHLHERFVIHRQRQRQQQPSPSNVLLLGGRMLRKLRRQCCKLKRKISGKFVMR